MVAVDDDTTEYNANGSLPVWAPVRACSRLSGTRYRFPRECRRSLRNDAVGVRFARGRTDPRMVDAKECTSPTPLCQPSNERRLRCVKPG